MIFVKKIIKWSREGI